MVNTNYKSKTHTEKNHDHWLAKIYLTSEIRKAVYFQNGIIRKLVS